jgi:hypothetical protein
MAKFNTFKNVGARDVMYHRESIPEDYHCSCEYCRTNFLGEIFHTPTGRYYTQSSRNKYYYPLLKPKGGHAKHICPGHWSGYRWAIQNLTKEGDSIFDPTCGTGSAIVEAINSGRNGVGIELEFPHVTKTSIQTQYDRGTATGKGEVIEGDARNQIKLLEEKGYEGECFDLILTGSPYPALGGKQSDAPERLDGIIEYQKTENVGVLRDKPYWDLINDIYVKSISKLKVGGKFVTIIKDPTQNKSAYLLHKMITDIVIANNPVKYHGSFIHRHLPYTIFMNTYPKQYPEVKLPLFQTGIILEKI